MSAFEHPIDYPKDETAPKLGLHRAYKLPRRSLCNIEKIRVALISYFQGACRPVLSTPLVAQLAFSYVYCYLPCGSVQSVPPVKGQASLTRAQTFQDSLVLKPVW